MSTPKLRNFSVIIKEGKIGFRTEYAKELFTDFLRQFEGKEVWLSVDERMPNRTEAQNRYYWLYLTLISHETGADIEALHAWAKGKFLTETITEVYGDKVRITKSTTELSKTDFSDYIRKIEVETEILAPDTTPFGIALTHDEYNELKDEKRD